jgi:Uma2 family endonuclease
MPLYWTRNQPIEQIITHPPVAVFEILSPEDSMTRILRKLRDYADMGIPLSGSSMEIKSFYQFQMAS